MKPQPVKTKKTTAKSKSSGMQAAAAEHMMPAGRSVFYSLFPEEEAAELEIRASLLIGIRLWLKDAELTQAEAAKKLGITQARVSDMNRGKIDKFSIDQLIRLAARAGLEPRIKLATIA